MVNIYHCFLAGAANSLHPLHTILLAHCSDQLLVWTDAAHTAFLAAKALIANASLLVHPLSEVTLWISFNASQTQASVLFLSNFNMVNGVLSLISVSTFLLLGADIVHSRSFWPPMCLSVSSACDQKSALHPCNRPQTLGSSFCMDIHDPLIQLPTATLFCAFLLHLPHHPSVRFGQRGCQLSFSFSPSQCDYISFASSQECCPEFAGILLSYPPLSSWRNVTCYLISLLFTVTFPMGIPGLLSLIPSKGF